jgi:hypothetical protein
MHLLGYGPQHHPLHIAPYTRNVVPLLPRETWIPTDLQNRVASYLDSASVHNLNRTCREWSHCGGDNGEHKHVHVTSANIGSILASLTGAADPNVRRVDKTLDRASFEIKVFDQGVQDRFVELCLYAQSLKINLRSIPRPIAVGNYGQIADILWLSYNRIVQDTLWALRTAPRLRSLHLHFGIEWVQRYDPTSYDEILDQKSRTMLGELRYAPALSRLYINLANNQLSSEIVHILCRLQHSTTLNTLSLNLDDNSILHGTDAFGMLAGARNITTLHLSLRNLGSLHDSRDIEFHLSRMFGKFVNIPVPSLQKLYLDLENSGLETQSLRLIATIRVPTLHLGLRSNRIGNSKENADEAISILSKLGRHVQELRCDIANPRGYPYINWALEDLAEDGYVPPWSIGTFMNGFIPWNQWV